MQGGGWGVRVARRHRGPVIYIWGQRALRARFPNRSGPAIASHAREKGWDMICATCSQCPFGDETYLERPDFDGAKAIYTPPRCSSSLSAAPT